MANVAWWSIIKEGWPALTVLLGMSILLLAVVLEKWKLFSSIKVETDLFLESIRKTTDPKRIIEFCEKSSHPLAAITEKIYKSPTRPEKERALQRTIQQLVHRMEPGISVMGTIASVAPFVGLLGTVIGIIKSFRAVSLSASGGANLVALGIAEALVGTAGGLIVAIPAVIAYNYFSNTLRRLIQEWEIAGSEIVDLSLRS